MSEDVQPDMSEDVQPAPAKSTFSVRRAGIYAVVLLVVFLVGFVPMWVKARGCAAELADAQQKLSLASMRNDLSSAVIDARRGDYEPARQAASRFFTGLRAETDAAGPALTQAQRASMQPLFAQRDEIITLLARSDPAAADRLSDLYVGYRKVMDNG
ncbi:MAG: hypothetical protein QOJ76_1684 [Acidobacteriota bacterium]|jgi:hypothetical protein|nr:hypothetical protein [Acidobacteriota bacterium]